VVAKENGRNNFHIYSNEMGMNVTYERELYWINQVTRALKEDTFVLFYQHYRPLSSTEEKDHFEVLVRLLDPSNKLILPDYFMPAAERYNLSCKIDRWVVENTFAWLNTHEEFQKSTATCNINLSGASIADEDFKFFLLNAFEKYHIPHGLICFEITETMAIIKMTEAIKFMDEFKRLGCTFALDDFGTGFSSYGYLKNLPVDYVKIDGNFIRDILTDPIDLAMVTSIRDIAEAMSIKTVAEFVENKDVMVQLGKMGVDYAQGYAVAEPDRLDNFTPYSQWIQ
jgi:EAL domain-containing protein (putative c-di-GMP-specific phosphodiesterase class I)